MSLKTKAMNLKHSNRSLLRAKRNKRLEAVITGIVDKGNGPDFLRAFMSRPGFTFGYNPGESLSYCKDDPAVFKAIVTEMVDKSLILVDEMRYKKNPDRSIELDSVKEALGGMEIKHYLKDLDDANLSEAVKCLGNIGFYTGLAAADNMTRSDRRGHEKIHEFSEALRKTVFNVINFAQGKECRFEEGRCFPDREKVWKGLEGDDLTEYYSLISYLATEGRELDAIDTAARVASRFNAKINERIRQSFDNQFSHVEMMHTYIGSPGRDERKIDQYRPGHAKGAKEDLEFLEENGLYEIVDECGTKGGMLAVEIALNQYGMKGDKIKASLAYIKEHPELKALDGLEETTISMLGGLFIRGLGRVGLADPVAEVLSDKGAIEFLNAVDQETQYKFLDDLFISSHRGAPKEYFMDVVSGQKEPYSFEPVQVKE